MSLYNDHAEALSESLVRRPSAWTMRTVAAYWEAVHAEQVTAVTNLVGVAEREMGRGDMPAARSVLAAVRKHEALRDAIRAMWVPAGEGVPARCPCLMCGEPTTEAVRGQVTTGHGVVTAEGVRCPDCQYWCDGNVIEAGA